MSVPTEALENSFLGGGCSAARARNTQRAILTPFTRRCVPRRTRCFQTPWKHAELALDRLLVGMSDVFLSRARGNPNVTRVMEFAMK
jgi:hypothetical protein